MLDFTNELSESRLREIKTATANRWTPQKRAEKAQLIHRHKPCRRATGPKTAAGKAASAQNALKHGYRGALWNEFNALLAEQRLYVREVNLRLRISCATNSVVLERLTMKLDEILLKTRRRLEAAGVENPALDARILVRQGAALSDADLIAGGQSPLTDQQIENIEKMADRRAGGEPVSRILGTREFWGMDFKVTPDTLDPRPDTETLVEAALKWARSQTAGEETGLAAMASASDSDGLRILDLGTGSGCILISLLKELPNATGVGIDLSHGAMTAARQNADALGVGNRAEFRCGFWFEPLLEGESFDLIVSNPPYIPRADIESLAVEVRNHDPILALSGGDDGLTAYKIILNDIKKHLVCGGRALFEIGQNQEKDLARLGHDSNMYLCDSHADLAGIIRVVELSCGEK